MKPETKSLEECLQEAAEYERPAHLTRLEINPQDIGIVRILLPQAGRKGGRTGPHAFALTRCKGLLTDERWLPTTAPIRMPAFGHAQRDRDHSPAPGADNTSAPCASL
jgi:hypothetical protein